jgi:hypothetical protein
LRDLFRRAEITIQHGNFGAFRRERACHRP